MINPLWTAYNNLHNEGGEGYNPHSQHIAETDEPQWSVLDNQRYTLLRIMEGAPASSRRYAELEIEVNTLEAAIKIAKEEGI